MPDPSNRTAVRVESAEQTPGGSDAATPTLPTWRRWVSGRRVLLALLGCSILLNGLLLVRHIQLAAADATDVPPVELPLGDYRFITERPGDSDITGAEFSLHAALLNGVVPAANQLATLRYHRMQQAIEELLRRAHGNDFEDPTLGDLKRQIQQRINTVLEMKAVSEVVITGLVLHRGELASDRGQYGSPYTYGGRKTPGGPPQRSYITPIQR